MGKYAFYFDMQHCIGCRACQSACKDRNDLPVGMLYRRVRTFEVGSYPEVGLYMLSSTCNHCEQPLCVANCPTGAMFVEAETGVVAHDDAMCIGCKTCMESCEYSVPQFDEDRGIVDKCDMCYAEIIEGENPACVQACPMRTLDWGLVEDIKAKYPDSVKDIAILPSSETTNPSSFIGAKDIAFEDNFVLKAM